MNRDTQGTLVERGAGGGGGGAYLPYDGIGGGSSGGSYSGGTAVDKIIATTAVVAHIALYGFSTESLRNEMIALRKYNQAISISKEEENAVAITTATTTTPDGAVYYGADMYGGEWKIVTGPLNSDQAKVWTASRTYGKNAKWGLYTANQSDAYQMAWDLGFGLPPIPHLDRIGEYPHYHVSGFELWGIYKHFHVWFGAINGG